MTNVVIVDDHPIVREGLSAVINRDPQLHVSAVFSDGNDFLRQAHSLENIDVVLLDITMRRSDGIEVLKRLRTWREPPKVLVLSMHPERSHASLAMAAGAHGYLTKDCDDETLLTAIRTVAWGGTYLSPDAHALLIGPDPVEKSPENPLNGLSDQERRVFVLLKQGLTVKEIARDLELAPNTVTTYKARLMSKLGAKSLVDLLRFGDT
jgi:DNA-binding NarL/FixJ family response regulator